MWKGLRVEPSGRDQLEGRFAILKFEKLDKGWQQHQTGDETIVVLERDSRARFWKGGDFLGLEKI